MGGDFSYYNTLKQYDYNDKLINEFNKINKDRISMGKQGFKLFYSSLHDYVVSVQKEAGSSNIEWPVYTSDFFPYRDQVDRYWTGFYTSRPTFK